MFLTNPSLATVVPICGLILMWKGVMGEGHNEFMTCCWTLITGGLYLLEKVCHNWVRECIFQDQLLRESSVHNWVRECIFQDQLLRESSVHVSVNFQHNLTQFLSERDPVHGRQ